MAWPPTPLPVNYSNATVSLDTHPNAHNNTNVTLNNDFRPQIDALLPTAWTPVSFRNAWFDFGGTQQTAQYRKINDVVYCRGQIKSGTIAQAAFNLPAGFRPPANVYCAGGSVGFDEPKACFFEVRINGDCVPYTEGGGNLDIGFSFQFSVTA